MKKFQEIEYKISCDCPGSQAFKMWDLGVEMWH